ncbi:MAG: GntR family transcriptional regulator, partial [Candidatus Dormiibacterota bacterium]
VIDSPASLAGQLYGSIDTGSPVPLYYQLAVAIERAIEAGELAAGSRLENEIELARALRLSRPTVRRALGYLVDRGRLVRKRGVGTVVLPKTIRRSIGLTSLYDDLLRGGRTPMTRVLVLECIPCPEEQAEALGITPDAPVAHVRRLRSVDGEALAVMENYLPSLLDIDRAQLEATGLYRLLAAAGIEPRMASQAITARPSTVEEARLLGVDAGAPLLGLRRLSYDASGHAVELALHAYVGERYAIEMNLVSNERS